MKMVNNAPKISSDYETISYPWINPGESEVRYKIAHYTYYEPWDWLIGVGLYEDEFYSILNEIAQFKGAEIMMHSYDYICIDCSICLLYDSETNITYRAYK